jgi:hypothetical protein
VDGQDGAQGPAGPAGPIGATGAQGPAGPIGPTGPQGATGAQGPAGPAGATGPQGNTGPTGQSAYQTWLSLGNTGTEAQFIASLTGPQGPAGAQGATGAQGPAGSSGATGAQGPAGTDGTDGLSAYEIWLSLGNNGTETQFLSSINGPSISQSIGGDFGITQTNLGSITVTGNKLVHISGIIIYNYGSNQIPGEGFLNFTDGSNNPIGIFHGSRHCFGQSNFSTIVNAFGSIGINGNTSGGCQYQFNGTFLPSQNTNITVTGITSVSSASCSIRISQ